MDIANGFNKFFVDIGQNLAKNIEPPSENVTVENYLGNCNTQSIFLSSVEESEIISLEWGATRICTRAYFIFGIHK